MKIIDRYILKKILSTFIFVVLMLSSVIVVITLTEKMDAFSRNNLSTWTITKYFLDYTPWIMGQLTPITVFIATVFVTSRMAAHTEIVAILSSGTSFRRMLLPYFIASVLIAILTFWLNGWVIPQSNRSRVAFELKYFSTNVSLDRRNLHMQILPNINLFLQSYSSVSNTGYQFTLEKFDSGLLVEKLTADNISWDTVSGKWHLSRWKRKKVEALFTESSPHWLSEGETLDTLLTVAPKDFKNDEAEVDALTITELNEAIQKKRFRGLTGIEKFETEKYIRYSIPYTTFILVFIGVLVSSRKSRGGTGFQIALGFMLAFVFIILFTLSKNFSEAGSMPPMLAAWTPNLIFIVISVGLYKYLPR